MFVFEKHFDFPLHYRANRKNSNHCARRATTEAESGKTRTTAQSRSDTSRPTQTCVRIGCSVLPACVAWPVRDAACSAVRCCASLHASCVLPRFCAVPAAPFVPVVSCLRRPFLENRSLKVSFPCDTEEQKKDGTLKTLTAQCWWGISFERIS